MSSAPASLQAERRKLEEAVGGRDDAHVGGDRLGDQGGDGVVGERARNGLAVVPGHDHGACRLRGRDAGAGRDRQRREARAGLGQQPVGVAVVGTGELDHHLAAGGGAGEADRAHRRLGAGAGHAHHLGRGDAGDDLFGQLDLGRGRGAEAGPAGRGLGHRRDHRRVGVAEDQRAPGADPVEVAVAVDVDQLAALAALDEDRLAPDLAHRPHGGVDPAGKDLQRAVVELRRALGARNALPPSAGSRR